jgi:hypothetical protein
MERQTGIMIPDLRCGGWFATLFCLDQIQVFGEDAVNDFQANNLLYWTLDLNLKEISELLGVPCQLINNPTAAKIDQEATSCALFLLYKLTKSRKIRKEGIKLNSLVSSRVGFSEL